jgi:HK97 family phage prohead protease
MSTAESATVALELRELATNDNRHTLEALCVPYETPTYAVSVPGHRGEVFARGAFSGLLEAPQTWPKVRLTDSHVDTSQRRPVAKATDFVDTDAGLVGRFQFFDTPEGRGAWENVREGTYGGLSVGFVVVSERTRSGGLREVSDARLHHVSLVDEPAYREARILATRAEDEARAEIKRRDDELRAFLNARRVRMPKTTPRTLIVR